MEENTLTRSLASDERPITNRVSFSRLHKWKKMLEYVDAHHSIYARQVLNRAARYYCCRLPQQSRQYFVKQFKMIIFGGGWRFVVLSFCVYEYRTVFIFFFISFRFQWSWRIRSETGMVMVTKDRGLCIDGGNVCLYAMQCSSQAKSIEHIEHRNKVRSLNLLFGVCRIDIEQIP